jgi:hypothetical protein
MAGVPQNASELSFRGEDCAVQDVIVGFLATLKAAD